MAQKNHLIAPNSADKNGILPPCRASAFRRGHAGSIPRSKGSRKNSRYYRNMDPIAPPSRPMIAKLLETNGLDEKLDLWVREFVSLTSLPFMAALPQSEKQEIIDNNIVDEELRQEVLNEMVKVYSKLFTASETLDMISYFKSPTGQKMASVQDKLALDITASVQRIATKKSMKIIKDGLQRGLDHMLDDLPEEPPEEDPPYHYPD